MGDVRFLEPYQRLKDAANLVEELRRCTDDAVIAALAVASVESEPRLANVLATEAQNRVNLYAAIFATMAEGVFSVGAQGQVKAMNPAAERILGWSLSEVHGSDMDSLLGCTVAAPSGDRRLCAVCAETLARKEARQEDDATFTRRDGTRFPVSFTAAPILREGDVQGAVVVFHDITARQRAENAARRLAAIVEASDDAILSLALDGTILTWNPRAAELYGYSAEEAIGRHVTLVVPPEVREEFEGLIARVKSGEVLHHYATKRLQRGGTRVDITLTATPIRGEDGNVVALSWIAHDVTQMKRHEEALEASEARYRLLLDSATDHAIFQLDPKGYVISWNPAAERIKKWKAEEIIGWHYSILFPPEEVANGDPWHELDDARREGRHDGEERRMRKDGVLFDASVTLSAMHDRDGTLVGFVKVTRDITERKEWERRLQTGEQRYKTLFEMFTSPALWCERSSMIVTANPAMLDLLGFDVGMLVGRSLGSLASAAHRERVEAAVAALKDGAAQDLRFAVVGHKQKTVDLAWRLRPIIFDGMTTGFFAVGDDPRPLPE